MGDGEKASLRLQFNPKVRLAFHGATITTDAGLLAFREFDDALGLTEIAEDYLQESRTGRNILHHLVPLLRQSIYSRLAGYDDTNDAVRLSQDPAMRVIVGRQGSERKGASTSEMGRFETEFLTQEGNRQALARMNTRWVERAMAHTLHQRVILDMDSSESPVLKLRASLSPVMDLLFTVGLVAVITMGTFEHSNGVLTIGSLVAVLLYLRALYSPVRTLSNRAATVQSALAGAERVFALLDLDTSTHDKGGSVKLTRGSGHIKFDRVTFGYNGGPPILEDFSLEVQPGETIALVGESGAGKTTLVNLLLGLYRLQLGRILLDGIDIYTAEPRSLRHLIAVVPQDPRLLTGSIRENIRYGRPDAPDKMFDLAARVAFDDKFIGQLSDGYETHVGQHGATLSVGQRQRIAVARALIRDAPILILDDATAALDPPAEEALQNAFESLLRDRTVIVIAHRLSTIPRADRIVVLDRGLIVGSGTHEQLLINCEAYRRLYACEEALV